MLPVLDLIFFILLIFSLVFLLVYFANKGGSNSFSFSYSRIPALFTPAEVEFLKYLQSAFEGKLYVFGKVRVADVIQVDKSVSRTNFWKLFNKISRKHFDYVLCDMNTLSVICAIELDDSSHRRKDRVDRDNFLNQACKVSDLPLIRIPTSNTYDIDKLKDMVMLYVDPTL